MDTLGFKIFIQVQQRLQSETVVWETETNTHYVWKSLLILTHSTQIKSKNSTSKQTDVWIVSIKVRFQIRTLQTLTSERNFFFFFLCSKIEEAVTAKAAIMRGWC